MKTVESDYYAVLELKPASSMEEVKSQYRRLAKRYHPDLNNNDVQCQEKLLRVNAAYAFLSDGARKAAYDARPKMVVAPAISTPKPPPAAARPHPSVAATGYHHAPVMRHPLTAIPDIRMTRSGWLGATAIGVLMLLGIGLSIDSGDQGRVGPVENIPPAISADRPSVTAKDSTETDPRHPATLPSPAPSVTFPALSDSAPTLLSHRLSSDPRQFRADYTREAKRLADMAHVQNPANTLYGSRQDEASAQIRMKNAARRALFAQVAADLEDLKATRNRIKPAIAQFSQQHSAEAKRQETKPFLTDIHTIKEQRQSVRDDRQALSVIPAVRPAVPAEAASLSPPAHSADAPAPPSHVSTASAVTPALVKPADRPASKPKTTDSSAPSFITWGK